jgi:hypothetical protein
MVPAKGRASKSLAADADLRSEGRNVVYAWIQKQLPGSRSRRNLPVRPVGACSLLFAVLLVSSPEWSMPRADYGLLSDRVDLVTAPMDGASYDFFVSSLVNEQHVLFVRQIGKAHGRNVLPTTTTRTLALSCAIGEGNTLFGKRGAYKGES